MDAVLGWIPGLFKVVFPWRGPNEEAGHYHWRLAITALLIAIGILSAVHVAAACGFLKFMGYPGFAQESALDRTNGLTQVLLKHDLKKEIKSEKALSCAAFDRKDWPSYDAFRDAEGASQDDWRKWVDPRPYDPNCMDAVN